MIDFSNMNIIEVVAMAEAGNTEAQITASRRFLRHDNRDSLCKARKYMVMAAQGGDPEAEFEAAAMLVDETFGTPNRPQAIRLFTRAQSKGHPKALQALQFFEQAILI